MDTIFWIGGALSVITAGGITLAIKDVHRRKAKGIDCLLQTGRQANLSSSQHKGLQKIPVDQITGSIGKCSDFDSEFRLRKHLPLDRLLEIKKIMKKSVPMPPVVLYQVGEKYFVMDGHHRVAAAKLLSHNEIVAIVINIEME